MKILTTIALFIGVFSMAQVKIGDNSTTVTNASVSLEFAAGNKGIILPWVTSAGSVAGAVDGTLIFDTADKKVKCKVNGAWLDYTKETVGTTNDTFTGVDGLLIQTPYTEQSNAKVSIGEPTATPGILVLEDTTKAMILPLVASPHLNIINPAPGMIVFDTVKNQLCTYDGKNWAFWKNP